MTPLARDEAVNAHSGYDGRSNVYPLTEWEIVQGTVVVCPGCAFTFGAEHTTDASGEYDCPVCEATSYDPGRKR